MGYKKKKDREGAKQGIDSKAGGTISIYRGTVLLRTQAYNIRYRRQELMEQWKKEVSRLHSEEPYYFIINPNV